MILRPAAACMPFVVARKREVKYLYYVIFMVTKIFLSGICIPHNGSMANKAFFLFSLQSVFVRDPALINAPFVIATERERIDSVDDIWLLLRWHPWVSSSNCKYLDCLDQHSCLHKMNELGRCLSYLPVICISSLHSYLGEIPASAKCVMKMTEKIGSDVATVDDIFMPPALKLTTRAVWRATLFVPSWCMRRGKCE